MKGGCIRQINRMIGIINTIDKIAPDDSLESLDRLQMVYNSVQILKMAIEEMCDDIDDEDRTMGFKPNRKEEEEEE